MNRKWYAAVAVFGAMAAWTAGLQGPAAKADWLTVPQADFSSSPLVFHFRDREVDARSARELL
jgi:hypothetical protein